ncbi:MAG: HAD hydrolase-like protein, partial [Rectinemataceae bacterium]
MRLLNRYVFDAVIFDMDGLMFDTENLMLEKWAEAAREFGFELPREVLAATIGLSAAATRDTILTWAGSEFPYDRVRA